MDKRGIERDKSEVSCKGKSTQELVDMFTYAKKIATAKVLKEMIADGKWPKDMPLPDLGILDNE